MLENETRSYEQRKYDRTHGWGGRDFEVSVSQARGGPAKRLAVIALGGALSIGLVLGWAALWLI